MEMSRLDFMENSQARVNLNEVLNLWEKQVKKVQKLLEMNESFPDGNAYDTLLAEFHVLERFGNCVTNSKFLLDSGLIKAVNKTHIK